MAITNTGLFAFSLNLKAVPFFSYEKTFILTGIELPSPSADRDERQAQLKKAVEGLLVKLDPELSVHKVTYVRVVKAPKPSILEVECVTVDRYIYVQLSKNSSFSTWQKAFTV